MVLNFVQALFSAFAADVLKDYVVVQYAPGVSEIEAPKCLFV